MGINGSLFRRMLAGNFRRYALAAAAVAAAFLGPQNYDIDGAETIWAFFRKFP